MKLLPAAIVFAGATVAPAMGGAVIDQLQDDASVYMAAFSQGDLAQSFQQSTNAISGAGIFLQPDIGSTDFVTITLYDSLGGSALASGTAEGTAGSWVDVFWSSVSIAADTEYFLVFTSASDTLGISGSVENPYDRGQVFANPGFSSFPDFDYTFRTYGVPAPASVAMLGLGGLVASRRRR